MTPRHRALSGHRFGQPASSHRWSPTPRFRLCAQCATAPAVPEAYLHSCSAAGTTPAAWSTSPAPAKRRSHSCPPQADSSHRTSGRRPADDSRSIPALVSGRSPGPHSGPDSGPGPRSGPDNRLLAPWHRAVPTSQACRSQRCAARSSHCPESMDDLAARFSVPAPAAARQPPCPIPSRQIPSLASPKPHELPTSNPSRSKTSPWFRPRIPPPAWQSSAAHRPWLFRCDCQHNAPSQWRSCWPRRSACL